MKSEKSKKAIKFVVKRIFLSFVIVVLTTALIRLARCKYFVNLTFIYAHALLTADYYPPPTQKVISTKKVLSRVMDDDIDP